MYAKKPAIGLSYFCEFEVVRELLVYHHEIFPSGDNAVKVVIRVVMDDRAGSTRTHPEVRFVQEVAKCSTQQTRKSLKRKEKRFLRRKEFARKIPKSGLQRGKSQISFEK